MWDDVKLRRYTSVTEQGSALIRLVDPEYHCDVVSLAENTLCVDFARVAATIADRNMTLIVPGASDKHKDWGVENYLRLAADLKKSGRDPIFLLGPQETELYRDAVEAAGFRTTVDLPLTDIAAMALTGRFRGLAAGNDTGVMHIIRACGCRSVTICFQDDTHLTWAPYPEDRHTTIHASCADYESCRNCRKMDCGREMTYERVRSAIQLQLSKGQKS